MYGHMNVAAKIVKRPIVGRLSICLKEPLILFKQNAGSFSTNMNTWLFNVNVSFVFEVMTRSPQPTETDVCTKIYWF